MNRGSQSQGDKRRESEKGKKMGAGGQMIGSLKHPERDWQSQAVGSESDGHRAIGRGTASTGGDAQRQTRAEKGRWPGFRARPRGQGEGVAGLQGRREAARGRDSGRPRS